MLTIQTTCCVPVTEWCGLLYLRLFPGGMLLKSPRFSKLMEFYNNVAYCSVAVKEKMSWAKNRQTGQLSLGQSQALDSLEELMDLFVPLVCTPHYIKYSSFCLTTPAQLGHEHQQKKRQNQGTQAWRRFFFQLFVHSSW